MHKGGTEEAQRRHMRDTRGGQGEAQGRQRGDKGETPHWLREAQGAHRGEQGGGARYRHRGDAQCRLQLGPASGLASAVASEYMHTARKGAC